MKIKLFAALLAALAALFGAAALAQTAGATAAMLTINTIPAKSGAKLTVTSPAFVQGAAIPKVNTAYDANRMPGLSWSPGPAGTRSYVVILEDTDVGTKQPYMHWIAANIPAQTTSLPAGMTDAPAGIIQSSGRRGSNTYFGPRPPSGVHHYHFQVFALDADIAGQDGLTLDALKTQMRGHVLASGVLMGTSTGPGAQP